MKHALLLLALIAPAALAEQFLAADSVPSSALQPDAYWCAFDAAAAISIAPVKAIDGSVQLMYSLAALKPGTHSVTCFATRETMKSTTTAPLKFALGDIPPFTIFILIK